MDLKSQQELYTVAYTHHSQEQHGIRIQGHDHSHGQKPKRKNRITRFILMVLSNVRA